MPRYVVNESEDDSEPKTGRRTRAALAASSSTTDSPIRRSARNRHGSVNPDGSSPESMTGAVAPNAQVTSRVTRRRAAAAAANPGDLLTVPENHRALRSRKNSVSSNISDNVDLDSAPGTPRQRTIKRLSLIEPSPGTPKPGAKTRRSIRASSETKTPPPPVRTTRRTRANSTEPEPLIDRTSLTATPTRKRRQQASAQPTEPIVTEEANESDDDIIIEIPEDESEDENSPEKTLSRSSTSSVKKSSKKTDSRKENTNAKVDADESLAEKSSEKSMEMEISSLKDKSVDEKTGTESEAQSSPIQDQVAQISATYTNEEENFPKQMQILSVKTKRISLDKSKELGMKIEDLLNKSTEEQEKSPGNKENEKLNISPKKIKKNLEFTVSNVNVVRAKSLGSTKFVNKSVLETKINTSLDEQVLFKAQYNSDTTKSKDIETNKLLNDTTTPEYSMLEKKLTPESPGAVKSDKKNHTKEQRGEESEDRNNINVKSNYTKIDETIVENEIIEEFTLYDSNDEDSKSEFSLMMEDDVNKEQTGTESQKKEKDGNVYPEVVSESKGNIFEKAKPSKSDNSSRKSMEENIGEAEADEKTKKQDSMPKKRPSLNSEETEEIGENKETEVKEKTCKVKETDNPETENTSDKNIDEPEPMEINDVHEEDKSVENSSPGKVSPKKQSVDRNESSKDEKNESSSNIGSSRSNGKNQEYDSDSNIVIDDLFQNISAEEWNKKQKSRSPEKESKNKRRSSLKANKETLRSDPAEESQDQTDSEGALVLVKEMKENQTKDRDAEASGSDDTLILKKNDSDEKVNKKRRSSIKTIVEHAESENEESTESLKGKRSPKKANRLSTENKIKEKEKSKRKSMSKSQEEEMEVDDNLREAETIPTSIDNPTKSNEDSSDNEDIEEENQLESTKNTPTEKKNKSLVRSATKLKKSKVDIYEFEDSFDGKEDHEESEDSSDEDETSIFVNGKEKKSENKNKDHGVLSKTPKTPRTLMNRNFSTLAVADSDSGRENIDDLDEESSDNNEEIMPGFLFNVESSDDTDDSDIEDKDKSKSTIDSDIAREMNLAGDDNIAYSDDDVHGDECRASESEHSDENDDGSDIDDFIVADDNVESSEYSEDDSEPKIKFQRILAQSLSEEDDEGNDGSDEDIETVENMGKKEKKKSVFETPKFDSTTSDNDLAEESPKLERKMLEFSFASDKSLSNKKMKREKIAADLGESELLDSLSIEENLEKSNKKLKKLSKPIRSLLNSTVDLCTPEQNAIITSADKNKTPDLNISVDKKKKRSAQKLKKNLVEDLNETKEIEGEEEEEVTVATLTPKAKTPIKEKKTPKSLKKNQRDSIQLIAEVVTLKPQISDLNKSMSTPNSESPVTKFLKKERLNESLPSIELKKKRSKSFDKKTLSNMEEEEQDQEGSDNAEENDDEKEIEDDSENGESEGDDNVEENGNEINGNSQGDEDEDRRDEESDEAEENEVSDHDIDENENEEEDGESSNEEISVIKKGKYVNEDDEEPEIKKIEKNRKSKDRKSLIEVIEDEEIITPSKKELAKKRESKGSTPSGGVNGKAGGSPDGEKATLIKMHQLSNAGVELPNKKKRARLESSETPQNLKITKKLKIGTKTDETLNDESDSDEAPESLGFVEARKEALQEMKDVADSLKAAKEAKKKKRRDQLDRIRKQKEAKAAASNKQIPQGKTKTEPLLVGKDTLKRLPEDLLDNLADLPERPKKKRKLANKKEEEKILPSKYMFSPGKSPKSSLKVEDYDSPVSTGGGTTHFSVISLEKVKKQPKKAVAVATFRERMLNRNPRQPISAFLMYQVKQKASGKHLLSRK